MAIQKPSKPDVTLPENFGGTKYELSDDLIRDGYPETVPTIVDGGNINWEKDALFKNNKYLRTVADTLVDMPIGKILTVDSNNRFEYANPTVIANDSEYGAGTLTTKSPSVKQVRDSFADLDGKISNCITKIPQDIKLELVDGTLTLKAGSKVYVPNGAGVFDVVTVPNDVTANTFNNSKQMHFYHVNGRYFERCDIDKIFSGSTAPSNAPEYSMWYDTSTNKLKRYINGSWNEDSRSLPFCIATETTTKYTSIDQVFNGFGYIGSTIFALPGVEGLIPNGRNTDGGLNSIKFMTSSVLTLTGQGNNKGVGIYLKSNELQFYGRSYNTFKSLSDVPTNFSGIGFITDDNLLYTFTNSVVQNHQSYCVGGIYDFTDDKITSFIPKLPIKLPDEQDVALLNSNNNYTGFNNYTQPITVDTTPVNFVAQNSNIEAGVTPTSYQFCGYDWRGKDSKRLAWLGVVYGNQGTKRIEFQKQDSSLTEFSLETYLTKVATPAITSNTTDAITSNWFNTKIQVVSTLPASPNPNVYYFIPE